MLIDEVTVTIKAGNGGNGAVSFRTREGNPRGGPDGGNGGNGGDVYLLGTDDLTALSQFQYKKEVKADEGVPGKRKNLFGKNAEDLYLKIPIGTGLLIDGKEIWEVLDKVTPFLLAKGGKGGKGNNEFKSATNQAPREFEYGGEGQEKVVTLKLRLIAQIGLIGLPNAGKSTLLSLLTNAKPKIGNYAFTTLEPNVGMMGQIMIADIPGLIEGASSGKGLGIKFLKHIEKTKVLVHCVDSSQSDVTAAYQTVRKELAEFNQTLLQKKEIVLLTKTDLITSEERKVKERELKKVAKDVLSISFFDETAQQTIEALLQKEKVLPTTI